MIKLIKRNKLGFEMYTVLWQSKGQFFTQDFWSEAHARTYVGRRWHHIDMNRIELQETK